MLLALWPAILPLFKRQPVAVMLPPTPVRPIIEREVIPRRQYVTVDKLRDDDALCIVLLM